eukprot:TRINITY_DN2928_c0_g1_i1.p1 TRINITY_DN2928_c0_g1~~TRINITY_DN2928_c0_g1_i1.p1  ORF type:complete len:509 (+),score=170.00 TRINITY_DN2928_c0_g1_i1:222-1748(+)
MACGRACSAATRSLSSFLFRNAQLRSSASPHLARAFSSVPNLFNESGGGGAADEGAKRKHDMLSPFTAPHQYTTAHPLVITRSEGVYVYDSEGSKYLDSLAGLWSNALGGSEGRLVEAATAQMKELPFYHSFWNRTTEPAIRLGSELKSMFKQQEIGSVFFTNDGSEANDTQVKLVWYYNNALGRPQKKKFIARMKGYHGSTLVATSLTGLPAMHASFDLPLPFVRHTDCPHFYRYGLPGETEEEFSLRLANNLEQLILQEGPDTVAAFIAEPVIAAGGVIPPPVHYFDHIQAVLKKYDVLLIADEVVSGFGRLGQMFGCEVFNIRPDLVSLAKALSSSYLPIGAVMISEEIVQTVTEHSDSLGMFSHGFTYSGHPVSCAVALEALRIYQEMDITERVRQLAPLFQGGMRHICHGSSIVGEVRGMGLIIGVEFVGDLATKEPCPTAWGVGPFFGRQVAASGMLVRVVGDSICMSPPLIISADEIQEILYKFSLALTATEAYVAAKKQQ